MPRGKYPTWREDRHLWANWKREEHRGADALQDAREKRGVITVDGIDISFLPRDTVRERLVAIPQEPFFVSGSVRLNPGPHDVATDEQLREALRSVGLGDVLEALGGLDAQYFVARATLGKRAIVVLDEATSGVDIETDKVLQQIIRTAFADYTIIVIVHRVETVLDFNKIAVLDQGR